VVWPSVDYPVEVWHRGDVVWRGAAVEFDRVVRGGGLDLRHGQGEPIPGLSTAPTPQPNATVSTVAQNATVTQNATAPPRVNVTQTLPQISATATAAVPNATAVTQNVTTETVKSQTSPQLDLGKAAEEVGRRLAGTPRWLAQGFADFARIQAENIPRFFRQAGQFLYSVGTDVATKAAEAAKAAAVWLEQAMSNLAASTAAKAQTVETPRERVEVRLARPPDYVVVEQRATAAQTRAQEQPRREEVARRPVDYVVQQSEERRRDESERYVRKLEAEGRRREESSEVRQAVVAEEEKRTSVARPRGGRLVAVPI